MRFAVSFAVSRLSSCFFKIKQSCWLSLEYARNSRAVHVSKRNWFPSKNKTRNHHAPPRRVGAWIAEATQWTIRRVRLESPNFAIELTHGNNHQNNVITDKPWWKSKRCRRGQELSKQSHSWTAKHHPALKEVYAELLRFRKPSYRLDWFSTSRYLIGKPRERDLSNTGQFSSCSPNLQTPLHLHWMDTIKQKLRWSESPLPIGFQTPPN